MAIVKTPDERSLFDRLKKHALCYEWSGWQYNACPECYVSCKEKHTNECKLGKLCDDIRASQ